MNDRSVSSSRRQQRNPVVALSLLLPLIACGQQGKPGSAVEEGPSVHQEIAWFDGSVEAAFDLAKRQNRPLFLYWGAEWCPPCHYLKNRVFKRPEFIARMQNFVPVYLDGDTERAQILGEKLEVVGYPTVILFDSSGQEVMRMGSTVPADQYEAVLDSAVTNLRPVAVILTEVLEAGPGAAAPEDLQRLAFHSWGQDSRVGLNPEEQVDAFRRLHDETPAELVLERSRFLGLYLESLTQLASGDASAVELDDEERARLHQEILEVLRDPELRNNNLLWIDFYADSIIDLLHADAGTDREQLVVAWEAAADALELDETLTVDDRLTATLLKLDLARVRGGVDSEDFEYPGELQAHARRQAAWAMETVTDESELQTVVNTLAHLLETAGLSEEAEAMLLARMNDTAAPYYFMSWIAGLKEDAGDTEAALEWYRKAYDASEGRYSRFRWGSSYLRHLMDLAPDSTERIEADSVEVLTELLGQDDAFAGGNHARLDSLEGAYRAWNEDGTHDAELARIRQFVLASCSGFEEDADDDLGDDSQLARCEVFLAGNGGNGKSAL